MSTRHLHQIGARGVLATIALGLLGSALSAQAGPHVAFIDPPGEARAWVARASTQADAWAAIIAARFGRATPTVRVRFLRDPSFIARTSAGTVEVSVPYLLKNPDDVGLLVHEMTHVVQAYPAGSPGWFTEGLADYVRYYGIEPRSARAAFDPARDGYARGYQPAAFLLRAVERQVGCGAVRRLDAEVRAGRALDPAWVRVVGSTPDETWRELLASPAAMARIGKPDPSSCFPKPRS